MWTEIPRGASSTVTTLQFSTQGNCYAAAKALAHAGATTDAASSASWVAVLSFVVIAAGAVGCVLGGELADRVGYVRLVVIAMAVSGTCPGGSAAPRPVPRPPRPACDR